MPEATCGQRVQAVAEKAAELREHRADLNAESDMTDTGSTGHGGHPPRITRTLKKWLRAQTVQPTTLAELQALLGAFVDLDNKHRPHRSLPHHATPTTIYTTLPKADPEPPAMPGRFSVG
jgi:hypothetical protein